VTGTGFSSRYKLKKTDDFSSVFNFRKRIFGSVLTLHYKPNTVGYPRLGIVVGKKTAKRAVHRNYMKRVLRELFRHEIAKCGAVDLLIRPLKAFSHADFHVIEAEFNALLIRLSQQLSR
jgi:ribonuclease P protein component